MENLALGNLRFTIPTSTIEESVSTLKSLGAELVGFVEVLVWGSESRIVVNSRWRIGDDVGRDRHRLTGLECAFDGLLNRIEAKSFQIASRNSPGSVGSQEVYRDVRKVAENRDAHFFEIEARSTYKIKADSVDVVVADSDGGRLIRQAAEARVPVAVDRAIVGRKDLPETNAALAESAGPFWTTKPGADFGKGINWNPRRGKSEILAELDRIRKAAVASLRAKTHGVAIDEFSKIEDRALELGKLFGTLDERKFDAVMTPESVMSRNVEEFLKTSERYLLAGHQPSYGSVPEVKPGTGSDSESSGSPEVGNLKGAKAIEKRLADEEKLVASAKTEEVDREVYRETRAAIARNRNVRSWPTCKTHDRSLGVVSAFPDDSNTPGDASTTGKYVAGLRCPDPECRTYAYIPIVLPTSTIKKLKEIGREEWGAPWGPEGPKKDEETRKRTKP